MVKSIDSRNCELAHVARNPQGEGRDMAFRYIGSKSRLVDQTSAYMGHAKSRRAICDFIERHERADALLLAGFMTEETPARQAAT